MSKASYELILPSPDWRPPSTAQFHLFDLDGTLITSRSGKLIAADGDDVIFFSGVEEHIAELRAAGNMAVAVDATHSSRERREELYTLAREFQYTPVVLWSVRDGRPFNAEREKPVPPFAYGVYTKYFADPREDGVECIVI